MMIVTDHLSSAKGTAAKSTSQLRGWSFLLMALAMIMAGATIAISTRTQAAEGNTAAVASISVNATVTGSGLTADVQLIATAASGEGIDFVEFYDGTKLVGKDSSAENSGSSNKRFSLNLSNVGGGTHTYRAILVSSGGEVVVSSPESVNIDGLAMPTVEIITPVSNRIFQAGSPIQIKARAAVKGGGSINRVEFYNGSNPLGNGELSDGTYNYTWNGAEQKTEYEIKAKIFTTGAPAVTSTPVLITVTPPLSSILIKDSDYTLPAFGNGGVGAYFVDAEDTDGIGPDGVGNDATGNGSQSNPWRSLDKAVGTVPAGSTIILHAGNYRGETNRITINKKLTLQPYPHEKVWLKGSEVLTGWQQDNAAGSSTRGLWYKDFPHEFRRPTGNRDPNVDYSRNPLAALGDQVFIDGRPLTQVARFDADDFDFVPMDCGGGVVQEGTFCLDYGDNRANPSDNRLYIKNNPNGKTVEATVLADGLFFSQTGNGGAAQSTIRGLGFAHYADDGVDFTAQNMLVEDCTFVWNGVRGLHFQPGGNPVTNNITYNPNAPRLTPVITGNTFSYNGRNGVRSNSAHNLRFEENVVSWNNIQRFRKEWDGAGIKMMRGDDQLYRSNRFEDNLGTALWLDVGVTDALVINNIVRRTSGLGIFFEVSSRIIIASNLVEESGFGIAISGSSKAHVYNNTLVNNSKSIVVKDTSRINNPDQNAKNQAVTDAEIAAGMDWETRNVVIRNNLLVNGRSDAMIDVYDDHCGNVNWPCDDNETNYASLNHNLYYRTIENKPANMVLWRPRPDVSTQKFATLSGFRSTDNEANGKEITGADNSVLINLAAGDFRLRPNGGGYANPARGAGQALSDTNVLQRTDAKNSVADVLERTPGAAVNIGALNNSILGGGSQQPDLVVNSVITAPANLVAGQTITVSATLTNIGAAATPTDFAYSFEIKQGSTVVHTINGITPVLAAGASRTVTDTWTATAGGAYTIEALVDSSNEITESNETNNIKSVDLTVNKITPTITVTGGTFTYNGATRNATVTTNPAGLAGVTVTYNGSASAPVSAGTYAVTATFNGNSSYNPASATATLTINKASATLALSNLSQTFDGAAKNAAVTTAPASLSGVSITYNESPSAPTNAGSYAVVASLANANYTATNTTGTLVISKANQIISFAELPNKTAGAAPFAISATASSNLPVNFVIVSGPATLAGNTVTLTGGVGTVIVRAVQNGNHNYQAADYIERSFAVTPNQAPFPVATTPHSLPGVIEAEDFDAGGEGVAYHDETTANQANSTYRAGQAVDIKTTSDSGTNQKTIGYMQAGEWLEYTVNVPTSKTYNIAARVSAVEPGRQLRIKFNGIEKALVTVPDTNSYDSYQTVIAPNVSLTAGVQVMRVEVAGTLNYLDLNRIQISAGNTFFASPNGSGTECTESSPCSLEGAKDKIRTQNLNDNMTDDIIVYLRGGIYTLPSTIEFTAADSGSNGHDIIYKAYPGETPIISGGKKINGWTLFDASKNIYRADAGDAAFNTRQLYVNGVRATRARSNGSVVPSFTKTASGFTASNTRMSGWVNKSEIEFVQTNNFRMHRCQVESISGVNIVMQNPCWSKSQQFSRIFEIPEWVENAYELLDAGGEWYLDRTGQVGGGGAASAGYIYYKPRAGENMSTATVDAPILEVLVRGTGTLDAPIHNIQFYGINFEHATWLKPNTSEGYPGNQAGFVVGGGKPLSNVTFSAAKNIKFERCTFQHLGGAALNFEDGSQNNQIIGNKFTDVSSTGIQIGHINDHHAYLQDARDVVKNNLVANNFVTNVAAEYWDAVGIFVGYTDGTIVWHNEISNIPYTGISVGWGWGKQDVGVPSGGAAQPTCARNNKIEYNKVDDYMKRMHDGAGIYTLSAQPNTQINNNYLRNMGTDPSSFGGGLYPDQGTQHISFHHNVIENALRWLFLHGNPPDKNPIINNTIEFNYSNVGMRNEKPVCSASVASGCNTIRNNQSNLTSWPAEAQSIINEAGLEQSYQDIKY